MRWMEWASDAKNETSRRLWEATALLGPSSHPSSAGRLDPDTSFARRKRRLRGTVVASLLLVLFTTEIRIARSWDSKHEAVPLLCQAMNVQHTSLSFCPSIDRCTDRDQHMESIDWWIDSILMDKLIDWLITPLRMPRSICTSMNLLFHQSIILLNTALFATTKTASIYYSLCHSITIDTLFLARF